MAANPRRRVFIDPDATWQPRWLVVVIEAATGVLYAQQCCGNVCDVREVEGYLVPLGGLKADPDKGFVDPDEFTAIFHDSGGCAWGCAYGALPADRLERLRRLVQEVPFWTCNDGGNIDERTFLEVDDERLEDITEAWVPVLTADGRGVLMWANCD